MLQRQKDDGDDMIEVKDGSRVYQFEGRLIANSTSWRRGADRWVEFTLYRTDGGKYIISEDVVEGKESLFAIKPERRKESA